MNKGKRFTPHPFNRHELKQLLHYADDGTAMGARRKAIFTILWQCGARRSECCTIWYPRDVFPIEDGTLIIRIPFPKGYYRRDKAGKRPRNPVMPREIGLGQSAAQTIRIWLKLRGEQDGPLFPTASGKTLHPSELNKMVKRIAKLAKIKRECSPHTFRHTFARTLYDQGVGIVDIMQAMGHHNLETTQNYLVHMNCTQVTKITREIQWGVA